METVSMCVHCVCECASGHAGVGVEVGTRCPWKKSWQLAQGETLWPQGVVRPCRAVPETIGALRVGEGTPGFIMPPELELNNRQLWEKGEEGVSL